MKGVTIPRANKKERKTAAKTSKKFRSINMDNDKVRMLVNKKDYQIHYQKKSQIPLIVIK